MKNDIVIIYSYPVFTKKIFTCSIEKLVAIFLFFVCVCLFVCFSIFKSVSRIPITSYEILLVAFYKVLMMIS